MSSLYKKKQLKLEDLYNIKLGKFMYFFYNKKTMKNFNDFFKKSQIFTFTIRQVSESAFFTKNVKSMQKLILYKGTKVW